MLYFISDAPHLMKTARNCFSNSSSHKKSRSLLVYGKNISWMHIVEFYRDYCQGIWALCPKLSPRNLNLTAFSCMNVSLAAQTMSSAVANGLELNCGPHVFKTVRFMRMLNKFSISPMSVACKSTSVNVIQMWPLLRIQMTLD